VNTIFDIITVGSNVIDVFVKTDPDESDLIRIKHGRLAPEELIAYALGTKIIIKEMEFQIGGGGTNTGTALARLGLNTAYLGKIGEDENGLKVFNSLKKEGIKFIGTLGKQNGYSVILDSVGNDRTILTFKGCNNDLTFAELKKEQMKAKAFYLCSMMGESFTTLEHIAAHAKKQKALIAFNPSSYLVKEGIAKIKNILEKTDVLILNDEEAATLIGSGPVFVMAKKISEEGPKIVVITMGKKGVVAYDGKKFYEGKPPEHLVVHETTGAGDAFGSTFVAALVLKKTIPEAMKMALINAESVIANYGAKNNLLDRKALEKRAKEDKRVIKQSTKVR
jgi:ribokinase